MAHFWNLVLLSPILGTMDTRINPVRYPTLFSYLSGLPNGIRSYPAAQTLADVALTIRNRFPQIAEVTDLPEDVRQALKVPIKPGSWVPEVYFMCQNALVRDLIYKNDDGYLKFCFDTMKENYKGPVMKTLMHFVSPTLLAMAVEKRWSHFKKGSTLSTKESGEGWRLLVLKHEPNIYLKCMLQGIASSMEAALSCTSAKTFKAELTVISPTEAHIRGSWNI